MTLAPPICLQKLPSKAMYSLIDRQAALALFFKYILHRTRLNRFQFPGNDFPNNFLRCRCFFIT